MAAREVEAREDKKLIDRGEILAVATDLGLAPEIVEKDYVLGWLLDSAPAGSVALSGGRPPSALTRNPMNYQRYDAESLGHWDQLPH
jgi:hypothetical protein